MFRGTIVRIQEWQRARRERRIKRLTAKAADLEEGQQYDLLFLHGRGFVRARGTGQSITRIYGEIENLIAKTRRVVIKPGTYFVARGNCQNMVTREEYTVTLYPTSKESVSIDAACINANMPIPGKNDRFYGVRRVSDDLARFLEASKGKDPMTVQAGVWALTDNYSGANVKNHLITQDQFGNRRQAVSDEHIAEAASILEGLGIRHNLCPSVNLVPSSLNRFCDLMKENPSQVEAATATLRQDLDGKRVAILFELKPASSPDRLEGSPKWHGSLNEGRFGIASEVTTFTVQGGLASNRERSHILLAGKAIVRAPAFEAKDGKRAWSLYVTVPEFSGEPRGHADQPAGTFFASAGTHKSLVRVDIVDATWGA